MDILTSPILLPLLALVFVVCGIAWACCDLGKGADELEQYWETVEDELRRLRDAD